MKPYSSLVIEFRGAEACNYAIQHDLVWNGAINKRVRYDRACRPKQCLKCHRYGHLGAQCVAPEQIYGYCGGTHDSKACPAEEKKCTVCEGRHAVWDSKCPTRKREMARVEEAKVRVQLQPYWVVKKLRGSAGDTISVTPSGKAGSTASAPKGPKATDTRRTQKTLVGTLTRDHCQTRR